MPTRVAVLAGWLPYAHPGACRPALVDSAPVITYDSRRVPARHHRRRSPSILTRTAAIPGASSIALCVAAPVLAHAELVGSEP